MATLTILRATGESLAFDAVVSYTIGQSITVSRHPTERDSKVGDHAQVEPQTWAGRGLVTESPARRISPTGGVARTEAARAFLRSILRERVTLLLDGRGTLTDMVMTRCDTEVSGTRGLWFPLAFDELAIADAEVVTLPGLRGSKKKDVAEQPTSDSAAIEGNTGGGTTPQVEQDRSWALQISDALGLGL
jgi:hypothetical protein